MSERGDARWLPWVETRAERAILTELDLHAVFLAGPTGERAIRIASSSKPRDQLSFMQIDAWSEMVLHDLVWVPDAEIARRVMREAVAPLDRSGRRLRGDWFDVTPELFSGALRLAVRKVGCRAIDHSGLLARVAEIRERRLSDLVGDQRSETQAPPDGFVP